MLDLFQCEDGVHALLPVDPLDPSGTECRCGTITMIGAAAAVKGERKVFLGYLIDTTPPEVEDQPRDTLVDEGIVPLSFRWPSE